jgi:hypothetical protein
VYSHWFDALAGLQAVDYLDQLKHDAPSGFQDPIRPLRCLRLWESTKDAPRLSTISPPAHTVVFFARRAPNLEPRSDYPMWTPFRKLSGSTRKLVINLSRETLAPVPSFPYLFPFEFAPLKEVVINIAIPPSGDLDSKGPWLRLLDLLRIVSSPGTAYTFVNTAALPRDLIARRIPGTYNWHTWRPATAAAFRTATTFQKAAEVFLAESAPGIRLDVQFLTTAEYEAKVGAETYRLETMELPWGV